MEISEDVLEFLNREDVQDALARNGMQELYIVAKNPYLGDLTMGELTSILIQAGIDPLLGMTEIPTCFLFYQSDIKSFSIPTRITKINDGAFAYAGLESITIPNSVEVISDGAFHMCGNLKTAELPVGVELYGSAFNSSGLESIELKDVKLQDHLIFDDCEQLKSAVIKGDTPVIPDWTFEGCFNLTHIELPEALKQIGRNVFYRCRKLRKIDFAGTMEQWREIEIDKNNARLFSCKIICSDGTLKFDKTAKEWIEA